MSKNNPIIFIFLDLKVGVDKCLMRLLNFIVLKTSLLLA